MVGIFVQNACKMVDKGYAKRVSTQNLDKGHNRTEKTVWDMLVAVFQPCRAVKKHSFFDQCWAQKFIKKQVLKKTIL